jgi:predicted aspartyl protease
VREALGRSAEQSSSGRTAIERGPGRTVPLVHGTIAGKPTLLLLDTGAYDHLLEGWFAAELMDASASGKVAAVVDHANRRVAMDAWSPVSLALDGWGPLGTIRPLATRDQTPGPKAFGVGGILSPQRLARDGPVVIDFTAGEMAGEDEVRAAARLAARRVSLGTAVRCGNTYAMAATVEGKDARLVVDTGAFATDLKASSAPGRALAGRSSVSRDVYAIGGAVTTRLIADAKVTLGSMSEKLDVAIVNDRGGGARCAGDGVVGMDVLGRCVLVIEATRMRVACD